MAGDSVGGGEGSLEHKTVKNQQKSCIPRLSLEKMTQSNILWNTFLISLLGDSE